MDGLVIAPIRREDAAELAALERECFSDPWSEESLLYEVENEAAEFLCARIDGELAGYIGLHHVLDEGYIANIAVSGKFRRRGVASALLDRIFQTAQRLGLAFLSLEVRASNMPAQALYRKYGFEQAGVRRGYYEKPREDALIMTRWLKAPDND